MHARTVPFSERKPPTWQALFALSSHTPSQLPGYHPVGMQRALALHDSGPCCGAWPSSSYAYNTSAKQPGTACYNGTRQWEYRRLFLGLPQSLFTASHNRHGDVLVCCSAGPIIVDKLDTHARHLRRRCRGHCYVRLQLGTILLVRRRTSPPSSSRKKPLHLSSDSLLTASAASLFCP